MLWLSSGRLYLISKALEEFMRNNLQSEDMKACQLLNRDVLIEAKEREYMEKRAIESFKKRKAERLKTTIEVAFQGDESSGK